MNGVKRDWNIHTVSQEQLQAGGGITTVQGVGGSWHLAPRTSSLGA